jgi:hypothetical protein
MGGSLETAWHARSDQAAFERIGDQFRLSASDGNVFAAKVPVAGIDGAGMDEQYADVIQSDELQ